MFCLQNRGFRAILRDISCGTQVGGPPGESTLGGCDEFREFRDDRPTRRSSCAIRSSC